MKLDEGWNQIQFNLSDFTRRAYGSNYVETLRISVHANCRLRRIYFSGGVTRQTVRGRGAAPRVPALRAHEQEQETRL